MSTAKPFAILASTGVGLGQSRHTRLDTAGMETVDLGRITPNQWAGQFLKLDLTEATTFESLPALIRRK